MNTHNLTEGVDFNLDENNNMVFTESYLKKQGNCCKSGCENCPWGFIADPNIPSEFFDPWEKAPE